MPSTPSLDVYAGPGALRHLQLHGSLNPAEISAIPAAAGGPKGLALIPLDQFLFGTWFKDVTPLHVEQRQLIGGAIPDRKDFYRFKILPL